MMIFNKSKMSIAAVIPAVIFLGACSSSSDNDSTENTGNPTINPPVVVDPTIDPPVISSAASISGKVIDGYISGALVWLDINGNSKRDEGEPTATSGDAGDYRLELSVEEKSCLEYSALYVDVPVGAIDEDSGEVLEAYQMALPPKLETISDSHLFNISPLTSVIWNQIQNNLGDSNDVKSCSDLINNQQEREALQNKVQTIINAVVSHHNIAAESIFSDFIANQDTEAHSVAKSIVAGLQASYKHQSVVTEQYPDATFIRVNFYQAFADNEYGEEKGAWYRKVSIWEKNSYHYELVKVSDDFTKDIRPLYLRETSDSLWGEGTLTLTKDIFSYDGNDYDCANSERVVFNVDGVEYALSNGSPRETAESYELCNNIRYGNGYWRHYSTSYRDSSIHYHSRYSISKGSNEYSVLSDWHDLKDKAGLLDSTDVIDRISDSGFRFNEDVMLDVDSWYKRITDDSGNNRITTEKNSDGEWTRKIYSDDGTYKKECSSDGETWVNC